MAKKVKNVVVRPAFGGGACSYDDSLREEACIGQSDKPCCDPSNGQHWIGEAYDTDILGFVRQKHNVETCSMLGTTARRGYQGNEISIDKTVSHCTGLPGIEIRNGTTLFYNPDKCGKPQIYVLRVTEEDGTFPRVMSSFNNVETTKTSDNNNFRKPLPLVKVPINDDNFFLMALPSGNNNLRFIRDWNDYHKETFDLGKYNPKNFEGTQMVPERHKYEIFTQDGEFIRLVDGPPKFTNYFKKMKLIKLEDYDYADQVVISQEGEGGFGFGCELLHPDVIQSRAPGRPKYIENDPLVVNDPRYIEFVTQNPCGTFYAFDKKKEQKELIESIKSST